MPANGPSTVVGNGSGHVGSLHALGADLTEGYLADLNSLGIAHLSVAAGMQARVWVALELPSGPGTYAFTFRTTDSHGAMQLNWIEGDDPLIFLGCWPYWAPHDGHYGKPAMIPSTGAPGVTTVLWGAPTPDSGRDGAPYGMRRANLFFMLYYPVNPDPSYFVPPMFLFSGLDIVRIN